MHLLSNTCTLLCTWTTLPWGESGLDTGTSTGSRTLQIVTPSPGSTITIDLHFSYTLLHTLSSWLGIWSHKCSKNCISTQRKKNLSGKWVVGHYINCHKVLHLKAVSWFQNKAKPGPELFFLSFFKAKVDCVGNEPKFRLSVKNLTPTRESAQEGSMFQKNSIGLLLIFSRLQLHVKEGVSR